MMYQTPVNISARSIVYELHLQSLRGWGTYEDEMIGIKNKKSYPLYPMLVEPKRINAPYLRHCKWTKFGFFATLY